MEQELKPCPFCGGNPNSYQEPNDLWRIVCFESNVNCTAEITAGFGTQERAIKAWNRRTSDWIPVSERVPETAHSVLVTAVSGGATNVFVACYIVNEWNHDSPLDWDWKVIAWQPLPKPYEAANE